MAAAGVSAVVLALMVPAGEAAAVPTSGHRASPQAQAPSEDLRPAPGDVRVSGPVPGLPSDARVIGPAAGATPIQVDVVLGVRHPAALAAFDAAVSTPGSALYRHYLPAGRFAAQFGPTSATVGAARGWLASAGLDVGTVSANRLLIPVTGTAAQMELAFGVPLIDARLPGGRVVRSATSSPQVPDSLAAAVAGVIGLNTLSADHPQIAYPRGPGRQSPVGGSALATLPPEDPPAAHLGPMACPAAAALSASGGWTAQQLASTYGFDSLYDQGREAVDQRVAIFELEPFTASDINAYQACFGTHVPVSMVRVDGGATGSQSGEAALDIEAVAGLAPSSSITVYSGPNTATGPIDTYAAIIDAHAGSTMLNKVITTSWGQCEGVGGIDPAQQAAETTLFAQATAQGQTVVAAAGDAGSSDCYDPPVDNNRDLSVDDPADQPEVTGVGGTSLSGPVSTSSSETVWNEGGGAGGGGISKDFAAPSWQQIPDAHNSFTKDTCGASKTEQCREVPDVSASSDPAHGDIVFFNGEWQRIGGTSAASPLWAALTAVANQGCAASAGFLNARLYAAGAGTSPPFNDITVGNNDLFDPSSPSPSYPATSGYDLASGWGSPKGLQLLSVFTGSSGGCPSVTSVSPSSGPAVGGRTVVVRGSGFGTGVPTVRFGSVEAPVTAHTPTSVTVVTPDVRSAATLPVTVSTGGTAGGTSAVVPAAAYIFVSPRVTSVVPHRGPTSGGGSVTLSGSGFSGATSVTFGSTTARFTVKSPESLVARVPGGPSGGATVDVTVQGPDGTSPLVSGDRYTYALPGYWMVASDGGIFSFGNAGYHGSTGAITLNKPVVGMAATPDGHGYWLVASDGGIFSFGDAGFHGSTGAITLNKPVVGMAATPDGHGYWLVASDGGIFSFGDAGFYGSTGGIVLNQPVVGMAATPDGRGYWMVASDGGVFSFGDAGYYGSTGAVTLNKPVMGMAATPDGRGYWMVASDGGIFSFGDAGFYGSTGSQVLNRPVVGMADSLDGRGYWLVASDGGVFSFGDSRFYGSTGGQVLNRPVVGIATP
jgi:hypothetical protein